MSVHIRCIIVYVLSVYVVYENPLVGEKMKKKKKRCEEKISRKPFFSCWYENSTFCFRWKQNTEEMPFEWKSANLEAKRIHLYSNSYGCNAFKEFLVFYLICPAHPPPPSFIPLFPSIVYPFLFWSIYFQAFENHF